MEFVIKEIDVVAAVIEKNGLYLIARRPETVHLGGLWEFPGGKVEEGESREDALVREIKEELDAEIEVLSFLSTVSHPYPERERIVNLHFYLSVHTGGIITALEHSEIRWLPPHSLVDMDLAEGDRKIADILCSR